MTQTMAFGPLTIDFDDRVLRPREWTAAQSRWAAELMAGAPAGPVLELCSGAGHIGLLAVADNDRRLVMVDANPAACAHARTNATRAGLADRVDIRERRLESALGDDELFAVVVADPPWVPRSRTTEFPEDPLSAIDGGDDGLDVARACVAVIAAHLAPGGAAVLQLGTTDQAGALLAEPAFADGPLLMGEVRQETRGVLALIERPASAG
ncbi:methyltransferase [Nocardioides sp. Soil774]|uniref:methyltransferase n=1 Tax=Nocardioides sp. Soil774 TaxID=1736408 RepID=UPI0006F2EBD6|nr:class I SAM-dependent methyltransferase [Nocardioides sp. Soil774]KRE95537.1 methyltransferase [Nocardioides sp. Soil774]